MAGWGPLPTGLGATPMLKELRAMNAQIHGTMFASYGQIGDLTVTGDVTVGDVTGIHTLLRGDAGIIDFRDDNDGDAYAPISYPSLLPGLVEENPPSGTERRYDMYLFGAEWDIGTAPWIRLTSDNFLDGEFVQIGVGALSNASVYVTVDGAGIWLQDGTAAAPYLAFNADDDTGLYSFAPNELGFAAGGLHIMKVWDEGLVIDHAAGRAGSLGLFVWNEHASGYGVLELGGKLGAYIDFKYLEATDFDMRLRLTGANVLTVSGGALDLDGGNIQGFGQLTFADAEVWNMNISGSDFRIREDTSARLTIVDDSTGGTFDFRDTPGTLLARLSDNDWTVRGALRAGNLTTGLTDGYIYWIPDSTGAGTNVVASVASGGTYYLRLDSSSKRFKSSISYDFGNLVDIDLRPASFWRDDDRGHFLGWIAEDLAEQDYRLATYSQDGLEEGGVIDHTKPVVVQDIDLKAVTAVLGAKVNRLEAQVKEILDGIHK